MYRTAEFNSTFSNEWVFDGDGNPLAPGARDLAEAIASNLRGRVSSVTAIEQHEYYGWGFAAIFDGSTFYNVLNPVDVDCYLTVSMNWYGLKSLLLRRPRASFDRYCAALRGALNDIPQVSVVKWQAFRR
jgi:hypothetical protein